MITPVTQDMGGLSHLVEAAKALTELVARPPLMRIKAVGPIEPAPGVLISSNHNTDNADASASSSKKREIFPEKLMEILGDSSLSDIVTWLPHGRSFVIIRPDLFCEQVLPKYLPPVDPRGSTKYPSFTRKLNRWGFRQATRGADTGAFHHPYFRRDQPELCLQMVCQKSRDRQASARNSNKRSLPPKKRRFVDVPNSGTLTPLTPFSPSMAPAADPPAKPVSISTEERSVGNSSIASQSSFNDTSIQEYPQVVIAAPISAASLTNSTPIVSQRPTHHAKAEAHVVKTRATILPSVTNDSTFVASTLKQRDNQEVLRAAQAMLYESFMKALQQQERQQLDKY